ncbi:MAG TPA: cyclic nucleotide-binding domain-containing protein [Actinomycetota bacterium]|nr:cyclic nucleotide-binding domain-containing protein [Actinomycetota bacterium]
MDWNLAKELNEGFLTLVHRSDPKLERLAELEYFDGCSRRELAIAARMVDYVQAESGTVVVDEGTRAGQVVIVSRGKARILRQGAQAGVATKGEVFGEMAVLSHLPYSETLVAQGSVEVAVIAARDFLDLVTAVPCLAQRVLERVARAWQPVA